MGVFFRGRITGTGYERGKKNYKVSHLLFMDNFNIFGKSTDHAD